SHALAQAVQWHQHGTRPVRLRDVGRRSSRREERVRRAGHGAPPRRHAQHQGVYYLVDHVRVIFPCKLHAVLLGWLVGPCRDVTSHPFGVAYSTRSDEEGFGGVYARDDDRPAFSRPTAEAHPTHPPPDHGTSQVKEEKARHLKDDKHAT
uniref:Uncharacterized protein n=1 Tax=Triticum urartu TaxID=4572 RepID=A0A8R7UT08_TRIUA